MSMQAIVALAAGLALAFPAASAQEPSALQKLIESRAGSVLMIRAVIEIDLGGRSDEQRLEIPGVAVDAGGLVMTSNSALAPSFGRRGAERVEVVPREIKVVLGEEEKEYDAFFAAKDTKFDLAFVQIKDLAGAQLAAVDFATAGDAEIGEEIFTVNRLPKSYDYAPYAVAGRVVGKVKKPRKALVVERGAPEGLPAFTAAGTLVGVHASVAGGEGEEGMRGFGRLLGLSRGGPNFVVSGKVVLALVEQAKKQAAEMAAEAKPEGDAPKEGDGGR